MLVVGGGIIGLEMACVYDALGVRGQRGRTRRRLMPGCDPDLVSRWKSASRSATKHIMLKSRSRQLEAQTEGFGDIRGPGVPAPQDFDRVLVAVGRSAERQCDRRGGGRRKRQRARHHRGRQADAHQRAAYLCDRRYRRGADARAQGHHEGKVAAEVAAGHKAAFDARCIPSVAYTDPEIAWVGVTETEAKARGIEYRQGDFPWAASGRSLALNRDDGFTKLLFEKETHRVHRRRHRRHQRRRPDAEVGLAIEMGADAADIGLTIHPHPTLTETVAFAAEAVEGTLTDLYIPKR